MLVQESLKVSALERRLGPEPPPEPLSKQAGRESPRVEPSIGGYHLTALGGRMLPKNSQSCKYSAGYSLPDLAGSRGHPHWQTSGPLGNPLQYWCGRHGEVYRARDTRLDRIVAIKFLPTHLLGRPELRERFEREARRIAGLNHPHICTLYDVGHQDGIDDLVMKYFEGAPLKDHLPLDQVLTRATRQPAGPYPNE
jgi:hypothetical protein